MGIFLTRRSSARLILHMECWTWVMECWMCTFLPQWFWFHSNTSFTAKTCLKWQNIMFQTTVLCVFFSIVWHLTSNLIFKWQNRVFMFLICECPASNTNQTAINISYVDNGNATAQWPSHHAHGITR